MNARPLFYCWLLLVAGCAGIPQLPNLPSTGGKGGLASLISGTSGAADTLGTAISAVKNVGDALSDVTEEQEIEMGEAAAAGLLGAAPLYESDRIQKYVNQVGRWVASQSERPNLPWRFAVLDSPVPNAFAAPGGQVFITTGLLFRMRSEAELAGALGHEIAHVIMKHHLNAIKKGGWMGAAADIGKLALDAKGKGVLANPVAKGWIKGQLSGVKELYVKGLSRDDELQADRMGMALAARAGYDPYGLPAVLQLLQDLSKDSGASKSLIYRSHPAPDLRLVELDKAIGTSLENFVNQHVLQDRFLFTILGASHQSSLAVKPNPPSTKRKTK
jgi:predicted Zn-dependent protease